MEVILILCFEKTIFNIIIVYICVLIQAFSVRFELIVTLPILDLAQIAFQSSQNLRRNWVNNFLEFSCKEKYSNNITRLKLAVILEITKCESSCRWFSLYFPLKNPWNMRNQRGCSQLGRELYNETQITHSPAHFILSARTPFFINENLWTPS